MRWDNTENSMIYKYSPITADNYKQDMGRFW
jgi:hypothetical protein